MKSSLAEVADIMDYAEAPFLGQYVLQQMEPKRLQCQVTLLEKVLVHEKCQIL